MWARPGYIKEPPATRGQACWISMSAPSPFNFPSSWRPCRARDRTAGLSPRSDNGLYVTQRVLVRSAHLRVRRGPLVWVSALRDGLLELLWFPQRIQASHAAQIPTEARERSARYLRIKVERQVGSPGVCHSRRGDPPSSAVFILSRGDTLLGGLPSPFLRVSQRRNVPRGCTIWTVSHSA